MANFPFGPNPKYSTRIEPTKRAIFSSGRAFTSKVQNVVASQEISGRSGGKDATSLFSVVTGSSVSEYSMFRFLVPRIPLRRLPVILGFLALGSLVAGAYGVVHDQATYTLAPEYFTKFKFLQFNLTESPLPLRLRVASVGFQATWWVGLIAGWFLCRSVLSKNPDARLRRPVLTGFGIIIGTAVFAGGIGWLYGNWRANDPGDWENFGRHFHLDDIPAFIRVGCIHNASYLGGLVGLVAALARKPASPPTK